MAKKSVKPRARPQRSRDGEDDFDPAPAGSQKDDTWDDVLATPPASAVEPAPVPVDVDAVSSPASPPPAAPLVRKRLQVYQPPPLVVSLDHDRKLTRKQTQSLTAQWRGENHGRALDKYFQRISEEARRESGHRGVYMGEETKTLLIGIPMFGGHGPAAASQPGCLPMEFIIAQDVFPLGIVLQVVAKFGVGKCHGKGTPILLADGRDVPVERVLVGDRLLGPDGLARTVLGTASGRGKLYRVIPIKGEPWVCNAAHILTLVNSYTDAVIDISVTDWLAATSTFKQTYKLFSVNVAAFESASTSVPPVDPYFIGVAVSKPDVEIAARTGFEVEPCGIGNYYGFTLDGDGRYLLGDFTVTHNSAFLAEIARWFDLAGGGSEIHENETKFSPEWYESILGLEAYSRMILHRCRSVEDWQRSMTAAVARQKRCMIGTKEEPGPGRVIPVLQGVDSIMGKMSEEVQEKILGKRLEKDPDQRGTTGEGSAGRSFPIEAGSITKYMRTIPQELDGWPLAIVLINHLRMTKDDAGHDVRSKTGGEQVNFQESFELEIKKVGGHKRKIDGAAFEGFPLEISCEKSSFGPGHRRTQVRVLWWEEEDESGQWFQRTIWDWDWATVHLLNALRNNAGSSPRLRQNLIDMDFHIACPTASDIDNRAWSGSLGMKEKDAMPFQELGALIRLDVKLMEQLRKALRIRRRSLLDGDYLRQLNYLAAEVK